MRSRPRLAALLVLAFVVLGSLPAATVPAAGQDNDEPAPEPEAADFSEEIGALRARESEVLDAITAIGAELIATGLEQDAVRANGTRARAQAELLADQVSGLSLERERPATIRHEFAIHQYIQGDPVLDTFLIEFLNLEASIGPAAERSIYEAIIDDANADLAAIDDQMDALRDRIDDQIQIAADSETRVVDLAERRLRQGFEINNLNEELNTIRTDITFYEDLEVAALLTGLSGQGVDNARPILAVKIDNVSAARPPVGLNQADIVIEEVVEGQFTRLVAIFHSVDPTTVGPIRSARTSDVNILSNLNRPILAASGGNGGVMAAVRNANLVDVTGSSISSGIYFRGGGRAAPHNLFAAPSDLRSVAAGANPGSAPRLFSFREPGQPLPDDAVPASSLTIGFGSTRADYGWNAELGAWMRSQNGSPHVDVDGVQAAPANVIVRVTRYFPSPADSRSPEAQTVGGGDAFIFTDGHVIEGRWEQSTIESTTLYFDGRGRPIDLTPGRTWIELAPAGTTSWS